MFLPLVPQLADDGDDDEVLLLPTDAVDSAVETESREKAEEDGKKSKQRQQQRQKQNRARMRLDTVSCRKENKKKQRERERDWVLVCVRACRRWRTYIHTYTSSRYTLLPACLFFLACLLAFGLSAAAQLERGSREAPPPRNQV